MKKTMNFHETDVIPYTASPVPAHPEVWVFAPHPDDEVYGCGGAIALHAQAGHKVRVVILTDGAGQGSSPTAREQESRAAAAVLGVEELQFWALPDRSLRFGHELVARILEALGTSGAAAACTVYAPSLWEAHPDHRATALSVAEALRRLDHTGALLFYEVSAPLRANRLLDIGSVWERKRDAMAAFASQEQVFPYSETVAGLNRYRALTVQPGGYAEAYEEVSADDQRAGRVFYAAPALSVNAPLRRGEALELPLVSVLVRTTGRASLQRAIQSALNQTYARVEVVMVDARGSAEPVAVPADDRVRRVAPGRALSRAEAANAALDAALGDWLIFLDDDDWFHPDHVERLVAAATQGTERMAYTGVECVDAEGRALADAHFSVDYRPRELCFGNFVPIHAALFARELVAQGCRFDPQFDIYEDWDFWLQVEQKTAFRFVPGYSAVYQIAHGGGTGVRADAAQSGDATRRIYAKWRLQLTPDVFEELVRRNLQRREYAIRERDARHALTHANEVMAQVRNELALTHQALGHKEAERQALEADRDRVAVAAVEQNRRDKGLLWELQTDLRERDNALHGQTQKARAQETLANHFRVAQAAAIRERDQARAHVEQLLHSTSWRVTAPLRAVGTMRLRVRDAVAYRGWIGTIRHALNVLRYRGAAYAWRKLRGRTETEVTRSQNYQQWVEQFDTVDGPVRARLAQEFEALQAALFSQGRTAPFFSIVMPVYNTRESDLRAAVASVQAQVYTHWELCICDDASPEPHVAPLLAELAKADNRIKVVRLEKNSHIAEATNRAIALATGQFVAFLDHDDALAPHALLRVAQRLQQEPGLKFMYSDEDKINQAGERVDPYFKTDYNLGLLRSHNYTCHFCVVDAQLVRKVGGLRTEYNGAQDYDLALRVVDALQDKHIGHLPHVLYHWRMAPGSTATGHDAKSYAYVAAQRAIQEHLKRRQLKGEVLPVERAPGMHRIRFTLPETPPLVSIVIPTRNGLDLMRMCLDSLRKTNYPNYEVIVVDNGSDDPAALEFLAERQTAGQIQVLRDDSPFNFSALNNNAVHKLAKGEFVLLMNNDIEIIQPEWLSEMVGVALEPGVGCVGSMLWYPNGRIQHAGVIMVCGVAGHAHKNMPKGSSGYFGRAAIAQDYLGVTGACLLVRRSIYDEVGGLDEGIAVAFNDVDFCLRVHAAGYRNVWTPFAELVHHESVTRGYENTPEKIARFEKEVVILRSRWHALLEADPFLNPNLSSQSEGFELGWPPRRVTP